MPSIQDILKQYWGYESFRPLQEDIITSVLEGKDTLALLPTGGGKSVCFQVPAMLMDGLCLVVTPLIALMKDQVGNLRKKGITAFAIYAGMSRKEVISILKVACGSNCKFLYVSPERLETKLFLEYLPALKISMVAVDEAHCISQWGYDFRPPYLRIAALRDTLQGVPVLALTASATPPVQADICEKLRFKNQNIFRQSFERPNLSYSVFNVDSKITKLVEILTKVPGSSIVYCRSRRKTRETAEQLRSYHISADYYHAGLPADERNRKQESWLKNDVRTIVCTNAFGMGIDKPDVRAVVHIDAPDSLENYYQESGRAGRDGRKAYAVLLYQTRDLTILDEQADQRFPPLPEIKKVYQGVANFLQIPTGSGEGNYFDFNLNDFLSKFKFPPQLVINTLKVLEHENLISFNQQVFLPSRIVFTCNKETLYAFEVAHPAAEPVVKALLRSYEGIFDQDVNISEKSLAYLLKMEVDEVIPILQQLHAYHIINYQQQKDTPQLFLIQDRVRTEDLVINVAHYSERKRIYRKRVETLINYVKSSSCRSQLTGNYFGDAAIKPCGVCDNCLHLKSKPITAQEFYAIEQRILSALEQPVHSKDVMQHLNGIKKESAWKVIGFLQSEKRIDVDEMGMITKSRGGRF